MQPLTTKTCKILSCLSLLLSLTFSTSANTSNITITTLKPKYEKTILPNNITNLDITQITNITGQLAGGWIKPAQSFNLIKIANNRYLAQVQNDGYKKGIYFEVANDYVMSLSAHYCQLSNCANRDLTPFDPSVPVALDDSYSGYRIKDMIIEFNDPNNTTNTSTNNTTATKGEKGDKGDTGLSAYQVYKTISGNENKSLEEYLVSLKGEKGDPGPKGDNHWQLTNDILYYGDKLSIHNNGDIAIGYDNFVSPSAKLDLYTDSDNPAIKVLTESNKTYHEFLQFYDKGGKVFEISDGNRLNTQGGAALIGYRKDGNPGLYLFAKNIIANNQGANNQGANTQEGTMDFRTYSYTDNTFQTLSTPHPDHLAFRFATNNAQGNATLATITSGGNFGIGTTNPTEKLEVNGDILISREQNVEHGHATFLAEVFNDLHGVSHFTGYRSRGTRANPQAVKKGDHLAVFHGKGRSKTGGYIWSGGMIVSAEEDAGDTQGKAFLSFLTNNGIDNGGGEKMRITGDGNVGIGTTNPTEKLEVNGDIKLGSQGIATGWSNTKPSHSLIFSASSWDFDQAAVNSKFFLQAKGLDCSKGECNNLEQDGGPRAFQILSDYQCCNGISGQKDVLFEIKDAYGINDSYSVFHGNVGINTDNLTNNLQIGNVGNHAQYAIATKTSTYGILIQTNDKPTSSAALWVIGNVDKSPETLFRVQNDGNVGIGTTNPQYTLDVVGSFNHSGSSKRYKQNINDLEVDFSQIYNLRAVSFDYKDQFKNYGKTLSKGKQIGLIAEEVNQVIPELTIMKEGEVSNVDYEKLSVLLLKALQEMKKETEQKIQAIEKENNLLKTRLEILENKIQ